MASLREATLRKLLRFSELRGTKAELSSLPPCTESAFPRTPRSFLSATPSCPLRPGQAIQTFPFSSSLCEPKLRCQEGAVRELLTESNSVVEVLLLRVCSSHYLVSFVFPNPLRNSTLFQCKPQYGGNHGFKFANVRLGYLPFSEQLSGKIDIYDCLKCRYLCLDTRMIGTITS